MFSQCAFISSPLSLSCAKQVLSLGSETDSLSVGCHPAQQWLDLLSSKVNWLTFIIS